MVAVSFAEALETGDLLAVRSVPKADRHRDRIDLRPELGIARETVGDGEMEDRILEGIDSGVFKSIDLYGDEDDQYRRSHDLRSERIAGVSEPVRRRRLRCR